MSQPGLCHHHDERIAALDAAQARWLTRTPLDRARADFEAAEAWAEEAWVDALGALTAWRRLRQGRFQLSPASRTRLQLQARAKLELARALRAERDRKQAIFQRLGSLASSN
jgi:hypothetical protein